MIARDCNRAVRSSGIRPKGARRLERAPLGFGGDAPNLLYRFRACDPALNPVLFPLIRAPGLRLLPGQRLPRRRRFP
ncbi:hypothetical protein, partial [Nonomuraea dietziae]|uniref:hypothetical protein n=1 Tax=Nonomuraea dietziae TaxID=65515 RepID=UPI0031D3CB06